MTRQQEIRNPLLHSILVLAAPANQLPTLHARLHEKRMQVLESLRGLALVRHQIVRFGCGFWEIGETELYERKKVDVNI